MTNFHVSLPATYQRMLLWVIACSISVHVSAQTFPAGFSRVQVASGITNPTAMAFAPDGRVFVAQQNGALRVIKNGALLATPFLTLTVNSSGERGLIGVALDPNFSTNQYVYLYYTLSDGSRNRISRFTGNGDVVVAGSEVVVLNLDPLSSATNHNGGAMHFKNGFLYVAIGENANGANAQNLDTYHGKLLRINPNGSVPAGNPFTTGSEQRRRVWAYGLRNPYTFDVQPGTGRILVNDVGQSTWEEIDDATTGGRNFGWPTAEGNSSNANFTNPVFAYPHGSVDGTGCAITGGVFFNPTTSNYPAQYTGDYFYQDLCNRWINVIDLSGATPVRSPFATDLGSNALGIDIGLDGNLYYLERGAGALFRIIYTPPVTAPAITAQPVSQTVNVGQPVTFSVTATGTAPLSYQWQRNNANITGATSASYTIASAQAGDAGTYRVIVSNSAGSATSNNATLTVNTGLRNADNPPSTVSGLAYEYYEGIWTTLPDFSTLSSVEVGGIYSLTLAPRNLQYNYGFRYTGFVNVPADGTYTFYLNSDDGSRLLIGNTVVVNNDGVHTAQEASGAIGLRQGKHALTILYFQSTGSASLTASWSSASITKQGIPNTAYSRVPALPARGMAFAREDAQGNESANSLVAYPNPAVRELFVDILAEQPGAATVSLLSLHGRVVKSQHFADLPAGEQSLSLILDDVSNGLYLLRVEHAGRVRSKTVSVSH